MDMMELETVTTVPVQPTSHWVFDAMLDAAPKAHRRSGDPLWLVALVLLGAFLAIGAGSFLITLHLPL
jgi:hypothetical protein